MKKWVDNRQWNFGEGNFVPKAVEIDDCRWLCERARKSGDDPRATNPGFWTLCEVQKLFFFFFLKKSSVRAHDQWREMQRLASSSGYVQKYKKVWPQLSLGWDWLKGCHIYVEQDVCLSVCLSDKRERDLSRSTKDHLFWAFSNYYGSRCWNK